MIRAVDSASTFELARYAEEQLRPLVDRLRGGALQIDLVLGFPFFAHHGMDWSIIIAVRENSNSLCQGDWVVYTSVVATSESVDRAVWTLSRHLAKAAA